MHSSEMKALSQRLVDNPHDEEAIMQAHEAGQSDPEAYATFLEGVGNATTEPALASHWLGEAASVWQLTLNNPARAVAALREAVRRDPVQSVALDRVLELLHGTADGAAVVETYLDRAKALESAARGNPALKPLVAVSYEEAAKVAQEPPLSQTENAIGYYRKALEWDPKQQYSIYGVRELLKTAGHLKEALPYFDQEQALVTDADRKLALYADEADVRRTLGDLDGAFSAMGRALALDPSATQKQQAATVVLEGVREEQGARAQTFEKAAALFVELAEEYPGEHGLAYSMCAVELAPANDRAIQLALYYGEQLGRLEEVASAAASYVRANPAGILVGEARAAAGNSAPYPAPKVIAPAGASGLSAVVKPALPPPVAAPAATSAAATPAAVPTATPRPGPLASAAARVAPAATPRATDVEGLLAEAEGLAARSRRNEAAKTYHQVLELDPAQPEAIAYLQSHLRKTRKFKELLEILEGAAGSAALPIEERQAYLKEAASLCETQLRDMSGAIAMWQKLLDLGSDEATLEQLKRLLQRAGRWDDLAVLLQREAADAPDLEVRITIEKSLAKLHDKKRRDPVAAAEAWARIAALTPGDETSIEEAVTFFESAERPELAAQVIADGVAAIDDEESKTNLYTKLGNLRQALQDFAGAGEAFASGAAVSSDAALWEAAENCYAHIGQWQAAAAAAESRSLLLGTEVERAELLARVATYFGQVGDAEGEMARLEQATALAPTNEAYAETLERKLVGTGRTSDLASFLLTRAERLTDARARVALRKRAAKIYREQLAEEEAGRNALELVLRDGDEAETLILLAQDAEVRGEHSDAAEYLHRLAAVQQGPEQIETVLKEAGLLASQLEELGGAIERYEYILDKLDPTNAAAFESIAALELGRGDVAASAAVVERHLKTAVGKDQVPLALKLADLYEGDLDSPRDAMRVLNIVVNVDADDFDAVQRLCNLAESTEEWGEYVRHMFTLSTVEGDEQEASKMMLRIAAIQHEQLRDSEAALGTLASLADKGDGPCRDQLVELGDALGKGAFVADKLVEWHTAVPPGPERNAALHAAFDRYVSAKQDAKAAAVAKVLARSRSADAAIAGTLERIAVELKDLDALSVAHEVAAAELDGEERAAELVRQAGVLHKVGVSAAEAVRHGEQGLGIVRPAAAESLLASLLELCETDAERIDLYARQIERCSAAEDVLNALARAAEIAAELGDLERTKGFFDSALSSTVQDSAVQRLIEICQLGNITRGDKVLTETIAACLANGGRSARDGGRTRGKLLRRAADLAYADLENADQAFNWLGESLTVHVDQDSLDQLDSLCAAVGDYRRGEEVLGRALEEVFDGPIVRRLLSTRAELREQRLGDKSGAAEDLRKLYDLSPGEDGVAEKLTALYEELQEHVGMIRLLEDQILRGRDPEQRAELARKVALLWRDKLDNPRETADAWRRVLRLKRDDDEAKDGLAEAKAAMLAQRQAEARREIPNPTPPPPPMEGSHSLIARAPRKPEGGLTDLGSLAAALTAAQGQDGEDVPGHDTDDHADAQGADPQEAVASASLPEETSEDSGADAPEATSSERLDKEESPEVSPANPAGSDLSGEDSLPSPAPVLAAQPELASDMQDVAASLADAPTAEADTGEEPGVSEAKVSAVQSASEEQIVPEEQGVELASAATEPRAPSQEATKSVEAELAAAESPSNDVTSSQESEATSEFAEISKEPASALDSSPLPEPPASEPGASAAVTLRAASDDAPAASEGSDLDMDVDVDVDVEEEEPRAAQSAPPPPPSMRPGSASAAENGGRLPPPPPSKASRGSLPPPASSKGSLPPPPGGRRKSSAPPPPPGRRKR